jgi:hypothetical protein
MIYLDSDVRFSVAPLAAVAEMVSCVLRCCACPLGVPPLWYGLADVTRSDLDKQR